MKKLIYLAAALLVLVGCNNKEEINGTQNPPAEMVTITGGIELPTQDGPNKVTAKGDWASADIESVIQFEWEEGDEIAVISTDMEEIKKFKVTNILEGGQTAEFTGEPLSSGMDNYFVCYPYFYGPIVTGMSFDYYYQQYDGKLRPVGSGTGTPILFKISNFTPVFDFSLVGEVTLGKIRCYDITEKYLFSELSFGTEGLTLSETVCHVPFSSPALSGVGITFKFYDLEGNLIMSKSSNKNFTNEMNKILSLPTLEVKASQAPAEATLADALVEGATFALGVDMREDTKTAFMEFIYQYNGEKFVCTDHKQKGRSIIEPDDPESAATLAMYSKVTLPSENIIRFEFIPDMQDGLYIEFNITNKQYEISEKLAGDWECSFGENGYIKVNDVNLLGDLTQKESTQPIVE